MIEFSKLHNILGIAVVVILVAFAVHQLGKRSSAVSTLSNASGL